MNGKKAKLLRKTVTHVFSSKDKHFPYREYEKQTFNQVDIGKTNPVTKKHVTQFVDITGSIKLIHACMRKQFKKVKRNYFEVNKYGRILDHI